MVHLPQLLHKDIGGENPPPFSYFDRIVVLNLKERTDRREQIEEELKKQGIKEVKFFEGLKGGIEGFNKSMYAILEENQDAERLLVFEDDCIFLDNARISESIRQLPYGWDIFSLGSNLRENHFKHAQNLYCLKNAWMTHAVAYSNRMIKYILANYDKKLVYDEWLRVNIYEKFNCYMANPIVCWQRPSFSDLTNGNADYNESLRITKQRMK